MVANNRLAGFEQLISGAVPALGDQVVGAMEGRILTVTGSKATFVIPEYNPDFRFGPAPFGRTTTPPQPGDVCLAVFVGDGVDRPWLLRWGPAE